MLSIQSVTSLKWLAFIRYAIFGMLRGEESRNAAVLWFQCAHMLLKVLCNARLSPPVLQKGNSPFTGCVHPIRPKKHLPSNKH